MRGGWTWVMVAGALGAAGCAADPKVRRVSSAQEVRAHLDAKDALVIDALPAENFQKEHIAGAVSIPYDQVSEQTLPPEKERTLIFYCAGKGCPVSAMAANKAVKLGYTDVRIYEEGLDGWRRAGLPMEKGGGP